jgi:hypothetical protein
VVGATTFIVGKTRSGKTFRAARLFEEHEGPAIFCDVQGFSLREPLGATHRCLSADEVIGTLASSSSEQGWPHILWLLDNYEELDTVFGYLKWAHKQATMDQQIPPAMAVFVDECWRVAPTWADARNPCVRLFTEGLQHNLFGVAISQWPAQTSRLIGGNTYDWYIYALSPKDMQVVSSLYRMDPPDWNWVLLPQEHHYWRYDGRWFQGDAEGIESEVPEVRVADVPTPIPGSERADTPMEGHDSMAVHKQDVRDDIPDGPR